jgi:hypothetical protein
MILRKISNYAVVGGLGALLVANLAGCGDKKEDNNNQNVFKEANQKQGAFVVIQEVAPKQYKIVDEYPASETRVILKSLDGSEKILSKEELDKLIKEADKKIEENKSPLTNPEMSSGGMSLGETILASAAGAILGSWIGSKLFNNPTYQNQRARSYKSPTVMQRSKDSFRKKTTTSSGFKKNTKSGFFGGGTSSSRSSSFKFGG